MTEHTVLVLDHIPDQEDADEIARDVLERHGGGEAEWVIDLEPPEWVEIWVRDQLLAYKRDMNACFMTVIVHDIEDDDEEL